MAVPALEALQNMVKNLETDLRNLLIYFGEDPSTVKVEDIFGVLVSFSSSLQVRFLTLGFRIFRNAVE